MQKLVTFFLMCAMSLSLHAQNCNPPENVTAVANSHASAIISWGDIPQPRTRNTPRIELFNESEMVNFPGAGMNGADVSALDAGQNNFGQNANYTSGFYVADDFVLHQKANITEMEFYSYQTGSDTNSTITEVYVAIYDRQPLDASIQPIWGGDGRNLLKRSSWTGIYRTESTSRNNTDRPIMRVVAAIDTVLAEGEYWVSVAFNGSINSGPWAVPRTIPGMVSTGNAMQYNPGSEYQRWTAWEASISHEQVGMPFIVRGFNVSDSIAGFHVYRDGILLTDDPVGVYSFRDDSLTQNNSYCYTIQALYVNGCYSSHSEPACVTTPANPCVIRTTPYSESFDRYNTGQSTYPRCWTYFATSTAPYIHSGTINTPPGALYMYASSTHYTLAMLPYLDETLDISRLQLRFKVRKSTASYSMAVGVVDNHNDPAENFQQIDEVTPSAINVWEEFVVSLASYTGQGRYIAFKSLGGTLYLDDVILEPLPACPSPDSLHVAAVTLNTAEIEWFPGGNETSWEFQYRLSGEEEWSPGEIITPDPSFLFQDLTAASQYKYDIRVRALCPPDEESDWHEAELEFNTDCIPLGVPYEQNFDSYNGTAYNQPGVMPVCWNSITRHPSYPAPHIVKSGTYAYVKSPENSLAFIANSSGAKATAILPEFTLPADQLSITFWARMENVSNGVLSIGYVTDADDDNTFQLLNTVPSNTTGVRYTFHLGAHQFPANARIAFQWYHNATSGYSCCIDDILVEETPTCFRVNSLEAHNIRRDSTRITWEPYGTETQWEIAYKTAEETEWTSEIVSDDTTTLLTGLTSATVYYVKIRALCAADDESAWSDEMTFFTECESISELPYTENFDSYGSGSSAYPTCWRKWMSNPLASNLYINTTYSVSSNTCLYLYSPANSPSIAILPSIGESLIMSDLQVTFKLRKQAVAGKLSVGVMTDPEDASTFTLIETVTPSATAVWEIFDVNFQNYQGQGKYIAFRSGDGTAASTVYLEDVIVNSAISCVRVDNPVVSNITTAQADISWTEEEGMEYALQFRSIYDEEWTAIDVVNSPHTLTGLNTDGSYTVRIKTVCEEIEEELLSNEVVFNTQCASIDRIPYRNSFDTYGTGTSAFPTCWSRYYSGTTTYPYIYASTHFSAPGCLYFNAGSSYYSMAITPVIDASFDINDLRISFMLRKSTAAHTLQVGFMTDPSDPSTFEHYRTVSPQVINTWEEIAVELDEYTGSGRYIAFKSEIVSGTSNTIYLDNFVLDYIPSCHKPEGITISGLTPDGAVVSWISLDNASSWDIEYRESGSEAWTLEEMISDTSYTFTGLSENTVYEFRLKAHCEGDDESVWTNPYSFKTYCSAVVDLPYIESFDTYGTGTAVFPGCWTKNVLNSTASAYVHATSNSAPGSLYLNATATTYALAATPEIMEPLNLLKVSFKLRRNTAANVLQVGVMSDPYDISTFELIETLSPEQNSQFEDFTVYFSLYEGSGKYIAFKSDRRPANASNSVFIDDIIVDYDHCTPPLNVSVSDMTAGEAVISWDALDVSGTWEIYLAQEGSDWDTIIPVYAYENTYTATGLDAYTSYIFKMRSICNSIDTSEFTSVYTFTTPCFAISDLPFVNNFDTYGTGSDIFPPCWYYTTDHTAAPYVYYNNYVSYPGAMYLTATSDKYKIVATPPFDVNVNELEVQFAMRATTLTTKLEVGVMNDPSDPSTFTPVETIYPHTLVWNQFSVPLFTYTGNGSYIAFKITDPERTQTVYLDNLIIDYQSGCVPPVHLTAENITETSALLKWTSSNPGNTWTVSYGPDGFNPNVDGISMQAPDDSLEIVNLLPGTVYKFYVRENCEGSESSAWSLAQKFTTVCTEVDVLPYTENFDTYGTGTGTYPICWHRYYSGTESSYPYISNTTPSSSPGSLYMYASSSYFVMGMTPHMHSSIRMDSLVVDFKVKKTSAAYYLEVGVMEDPSDPETFTRIETITPSANSTWENARVSLRGYNGTGRYIAFKSGNGSAANTVYIDDVTIDYRVPCYAPENLAVVSFTHNTADITWNSDAAEWILEYRKAGEEWIVADTFDVTSARLTSLDANTPYEVRVRTYCRSENEMSPWTTSVSFTTTCPVHTAPFLETFDGTEFVPSCWNLYSGKVSDLFSGATPPSPTEEGWERNTSDQGLSTPHAVLNVTGAQLHHWLVTPVIEIDIEDPVLYFNLALTEHGGGNAPSTGNNTDDRFMVLIAVEDGNKWVDTNVVEWNNSGTGDYVYNAISVNGERITIPLTPFSGERIRIAFYGESSVVNTDTDLHIDSVYVRTAISVDPEDCTTPTDLTAQYDSGEAVISWSSGNSATGWTLQYRVRGAVNWEEVQCGTDCHLSTYTLAEMDADTVYEIQIKALCGDEESEWSSTLSVNTTVGIDEWFLDRSLTVFPNPATDYIEYEIRSADIILHHIALYDIYGKQIRGISISDNKNRIEISDLSPGFYLLRFETNSGTITRKFIRK